MEKSINELQQLLDTKWNDDYLRLLAIFDHLVECTEKYKAYKLEAINPYYSKERLKEELFKELVDLQILLDMCQLKCGDELYSDRVANFQMKLEEQKMKCIKATDVIFNWFCDKDGDERYSIYIVGERYRGRVVTSIEYYEPEITDGVMAKHYCDVNFSDGTSTRVFNIDSIDLTGQTAIGRAYCKQWLQERGDKK